MRWLLHGSLAPEVAAALRRHGHQTQTDADAPIDDDPVELLKTANRLQLDVLTSDPRLARALYDQNVPFGRSIVLIQVAGADDQADAVERLFQRYKRLAPGRMYTVTGNRVKIRQLPAKA